MKIKTALIGFGMAGQFFHLPALYNSSDYNVKMVMTNNLKNIKILKEKYKEVTIINNFDEAINNKDIDLIIIATSNDVHYEYTNRALKAGKHVVCEKPFVRKYKDAKKLYKYAAKNNLVLKVFHNRKYDGDILTLKDVLSNKNFGKPVSFETRFDRLSPEIDENWRNKDTVMAGVFYDLAPHLVHHAIDLFGMPIKVSNHLFYDRINSIVDDHFEMTLFYESGFYAKLSSHTLEREKMPKIAFHGNISSYVKYGFDNPDYVLNRSNNIYQNNNLISKYITNDLKVENIPLKKGTHYLFYEKLASYITNGNVHNEDIKLALDVVKVMEKALISNRLGKVIKI